MALYLSSFAHFPTQSMICKRIIFLFSLYCFCLVAQAESSLQHQVAGLRQDVMSINHQVGQLQMQVEGLQLEITQLKKALQDKENSNIHKDIKTLFQQERQAILEIVSGQINILAQEMNQVLSKKSTHFSKQENYPKEGVSYTIKKGDTLSKIATENKSTISYIQAANNIENPKDIKAGQVLFVPQKN